ncbi:MAG TPA: type III-B CRISPR module RAMP protein Cmr1 [Desulfobacterales bacterium]|nr:type III-B CRISPR module RAMP protein Cmr1 [Desulfobacterales bacterium]
MAITLTLQFKILTPLFLGGAIQKEPDLRPPEFKGLLRFWYRAISPDYYEKEKEFFGSTRKDGDSKEETIGQSPFLLRAKKDFLETMSWNDVNLRRFNQRHGRQTRNGLTYLGYPFGLRGGQRDAFKPGGAFELRLIILRDQEKERLRQAVAAACWLMAHVGGAGSRHRRGFGSLALTDWQCQEGEEIFPELKALPLLSNSSTTREWQEGFEKALGRFRRWFGPFDSKEVNNKFVHPHLGPAFRWRLSEHGFAEWEEAMNVTGRMLQDFRLRMQPDYQDVKAHLMGAARGGGPLRNAPCRVTFGLPLEFRFSSQTATFMPYDEQEKTTRERQGSLLFLRLASIGGMLHPLYLRLDGSVPGLDNPVAVQHHGRPLLQPKRNSLDDFMNHVTKEA